MRALFLSGLFLLVASSLAALPAHAQNARQEPGYVNPKLVEDWFETRADTEVNLGDPLLKMVAEGLRERKPDVAALLEKLQGVYVRRYADPGNVRPDILEKRTSALVERLETEGWQTVVRNREESGLVNIFLKTRGDETISGLVVLKTTPDMQDGENVFVNIVGNVTPQEIGKLTGSISGLDSLGNLGGGLSGGSDSTRTESNDG